MMQVNKAPEDELQCFSCAQYILEVVHEGLGQMNETPSNHYHQNKLSPKQVAWEHPDIRNRYGKHCIKRLFV